MANSYVNSSQNQPDDFTSFLGTLSSIPDYTQETPGFNAPSFISPTRAGVVRDDYVPFNPESVFSKYSYATDEASMEEEDYSFSESPTKKKSAFSNVPILGDIYDAHKQWWGWGLSAAEDIVEDNPSFNWAFGLAAQGAKGLMNHLGNGADFLLGGARLLAQTPERMKEFVKSDDKSIGAIWDRGVEDYYDIKTGGGGIKPSKDVVSRLSRLSDFALQLVQNEIKTQRSSFEKDMDTLVDMKQENAAVQFLGELGSSMPYTLTSMIPYGIGAVINFGSMEQSAIDQKTQEYIAKGIPLDLDAKEKIILYSIGVGAVEAATEQIFPIMGKALGKVGAKALATTLKSAPVKSAFIYWGKRLAKQAAEEGLEEVLSEFGQGLLAKALTDPDIDWFSLDADTPAAINVPDALRAFLGGAVMGGAFSVVGTAGTVDQFKKTKEFYKTLDGVTVEEVTKEIRMKGQEAFLTDLQEETNMRLFKDIMIDTMRKQQSNKDVDQVDSSLRTAETNLNNAVKDVNNASTETLYKSAMEAIKSGQEVVGELKTIAENVGTKTTALQIANRISQLVKSENRYVEDLKMFPNDSAPQLMRQDLAEIRAQIEDYKLLAKAMKDYDGTNVAESVKRERAALPKMITKTRAYQYGVFETAPGTFSVMRKSNSDKNAQYVPIKGNALLAGTYNSIEQAANVLPGIASKAPSAPVKAKDAQNKEKSSSAKKTPTARKQGAKKGTPVEAPAVKAKKEIRESRKDTPKGRVKMSLAAYAASDIQNNAFLSYLNKYEGDTAVTHKDVQADKNIKADIQNYQNELRQLTGDAGLTVKLVSDSEYYREISGKTVDLSAFVSAISERQLVLYRISSSSGMKLSGFVQTDNANNIYLNVDNVSNFGETILHELYHIISIHNVNADFEKAALRALFGVQPVDFVEIEKKYKELAGVSDKQLQHIKTSTKTQSEYEKIIKEELIATRAQNLFSSPEFWRELNRRTARKNKTFMRRVIDWIRTMYNKLFVGRREINTYLDALQAARLVRKDDLVRDRQAASKEVVDSIRGVNYYFPTPSRTLHAMSEGERYQGFSNATAEAQYRKNQVLPPKDTSGKTKMAAIKEGVAGTFFRGRFGTLPYTQQYAEVRKNLFNVLSVNGIQRDLALTEIAGIYDSLSPEMYDLVSRAIVLSDLVESYKMGTYTGDVDPDTGEINLPLFQSIGQVYFEMENIQRAAMSARYNKIIVSETNTGKKKFAPGRAVNAFENSQLFQILSRRRDIMNEVRAELSAIGRKVGFDPTMYFTRQDYMAHIVIEYNNLNADDKARLHSSVLGKYLKRSGSINEYVTDPAIADYLVLQKMNRDIVKMNLLGSIQDLDISKSIKDGQIPDGYEAVYASQFNLGLPQQYVYDMVDATIEAINSSDITEGVLTEELTESIKKNYANKRMVIPSAVVKAVMPFATAHNIHAVDKVARQVVHSMKWMYTAAPHRVVPFTIRNATGDLEFALSTFPGALRKKYWSEAKNAIVMFFATGRTAIDADTGVNLMKEWIKTGALQGTLTETTLSVFNSLGQWEYKESTAFKNYEKENGTTSDKTQKQKAKDMFKSMEMFLKKAGHRYSDILSARELFLRYMVFSYCYKEELNNKSELPAFYGKSIPAHIQGLKSRADKAGQLTEDAIGNYRDTSVFSNKMRPYLWFVSWLEIKTKHMVRLTRNCLYKNPAVSEAMGYKLAERLGLKTPSKFRAYMLGRTFGGYLVFFAALALWNGVFREEDDKLLPDYVKESPHITFGRINGKIVYWQGFGALTDALNTYGLWNIGEDIKDVINLRASWQDKLKDVLLSPAIETLSSMNPLVSGFQSMITGVKMFPPGAPVSSLPEHVFDMAGLGGEYDALTKPGTDKAQKYLLNRLGIKYADAREQEYWTAKDLVSDFKDAAGISNSGTSSGNKRSTALYYYKMAIRYGDMDSAKEYLARYIVLGGTKSGMKTSFSSMNPLYGLDAEEKAALKEWLADDEIEIMYNAIEYYNDMATIGLAFADENAK
jgi:hypothetical protein